MSESSIESPVTPSHESRSARLKGALKEVVDPFVHLVRAPRALWGINLSYLLEGLVYFGILTIIGIYLSDMVGLSDLHAGWVLSVFTGGITLSMLFLGGTADRIGVRRAMLLSLGLLLIGRLLLAASGTVFLPNQGISGMMFLVVAAGLAVVVVGYGMYQPAAYAGIKQCTDKKTATIGYAMIYGLMNLGAFLSGILSPIIRESGGMSSVFWTYAGLCLMALLVVLFLLTPKVVKRDTLTPLDKALQPDSVTPKSPRAGLLSGTFLVLVLAVLASVASVVGLYVTRIQPDYSRSTSTISGQLEQLYKSLQGLSRAAAAGDVDDLALKAREVASYGGIIDQLARRNQENRGGIFPPGEVEGAQAVNPAPFGLVRESVLSEAALLSSVKDDPEMLTRRLAPGSELAAEIRDELRFIGLFQMAAAEALIRTVDPGVIQQLRIRFSNPGETEIPLSDGQVQVIAASAAKGTVAMLEELAFYMSDLHTRWIERRIPGLDPVARMLEADAYFLTEAVKSWSLGSQEPLEAVVLQRLVSMSALLIQQIAPALRDLSVPTARGLAGVDLLAARVLSYREFASQTDGLLTATLEVPFSTRLMNWGLRYGLLLLLALVLVGMATADLLRKRPEHPFNNGRFVFLIFILIPVQTLFAHNWLTLPYYISRAFGGTFVGEKFEFFSNINPILIFVLSPVVAALTTRSKVYSMMIWGTLVMALPTFLLSLSLSPTMLLTYILFMSIGEAMWQPRFLQWVAEIAPEGKTGAYMGIAQFPWFLTKVLTGAYSGYFLSQYCPMVGPQNTQMLWFLYGSMAMVSPLCLFLFRGWATRSPSGKTG